MTTHDKAYFIKEFGVPERFLSMVMEIPPLLPGERSEDFFAFFQTMLNELVPSTDLEWFLTVDIAWILWDLQRYRRWKNVIIALNQRAALGEALMLTDPNYTTVGPTETMRKKNQLKADGLKGNLKADPALARELDEYGYNQDALNALSFMKGGGFTGGNREIYCFCAPPPDDDAPRSCSSSRVYGAHQVDREEDSRRASSGRYESAGFDYLHRSGGDEKMIISERRLLANKRNAQRSTGPKTAKGKLISRNNAFRHGLARRVATDPAFSTHLENLTAMLAEGSNDAWHRELAQNVAECMLELDRIRAARSQILLGLGEFESADLAGHEEAVAQLQKIDRYEQRLYARRRKAVRALVDASRSGAQENEARLEHRCNKASSGEGPISQNEANNWQNEPKFGTTDSALPEQDRV